MHIAGLPRHSLLSKIACIFSVKTMTAPNGCCYIAAHRPRTRKRWHVLSLPCLLVATDLRWLIHFAHGSLNVFSAA